MIPYPAVILALALVAFAAYWASTREESGAMDGGPLFAPDGVSPAGVRAKDASTATVSAWRANVVNAASEMQVAFDTLLAASPGYRIGEPAVNAIVALADTATKARLTTEARVNPIGTLARGSFPLKAIFAQKWLDLQAAIAAPEV